MRKWFGLSLNAGVEVYKTKEVNFVLRVEIKRQIQNDIKSSS